MSGRRMSGTSTRFSQIYFELRFLTRPQLGPFFCPEIRAFTGFWGEISSTVSKVLSDSKVLLKHKNGR